LAQVCLQRRGSSPIVLPHSIKLFHHGKLEEIAELQP